MCYKYNVSTTTTTTPPYFRSEPESERADVGSCDRELSEEPRACVLCSRQLRCVSGANLSLREPMWARAIESCLKSLVHAFCVHDHYAVFQERIWAWESRCGRVRLRVVWRASFMRSVCTTTMLCFRSESESARAGVGACDRELSEEPRACVLCARPSRRERVGNHLRRCRSTGAQTFDNHQPVRGTSQDRIESLQ